MQRPGHVLGTATWSVSPKSGDIPPSSPLKTGRAPKAKGLSPDHPFFRGELLVLGGVWESYELFNFCLSCLMSLMSHRLLVRHPFLVQRLIMCRFLHGFQGSGSLSVSNASRKCACVHQKQSASLRQTMLWEMLLLLFWNPVSKHEVAFCKTLWCKRFHASLLLPLHKCSHLRSYTVIHHTFSIRHSNMCLLQGTSIYGQAGTLRIIQPSSQERRGPYITNWPKQYIMHQNT